MAEFYRREGGYLLRFPDQADFLLEPGPASERFEVTAWPVLGCPDRVVANLYRNAIAPMIGNHTGGLFLHGSAVAVRDGTCRLGGAICFLGLSRSGKTTLAGAFAKRGHPFLTEDVIDLRLRDNHYWLQPKASKLRLFCDSARHLFGTETRFADEDEKQDVNPGATLPFASKAVPLRRIHILGEDRRAELALEPLSPSAALAKVLPHAFILDVEDQQRLRAHFARLADLTDIVPSRTLDYPRDYAELPAVIEAVTDDFGVSGDARTAPHSP